MFDKLCAPSKLYLILSTIIIFITLTFRIEIGVILVKILFIILWTYVLDFICKKGYTTVSWILVLLPHIFMILLFAFTVELFVLSKKNIDENN